MSIPEELRRLPQWIAAGSDKIPLNPKTGKAASVTDSSTWGTYEEALKFGSAHIGFVLTETDPYVLIDLDEPETEEQKERHNRILEHFNSYTEVSQSGKGLHIIVKGKLPHGVRSRDKVEVYPHQRYMICTGKVYRDVEIKDTQEMLDILFREINQHRAGLAELTEHDEVISDRDLVDMASRAVNGEKFDALCRGEWEGSYPSQSEADFALLSIFAFYTRSNEQVMRLFRMSKLGERDKALRDGYLLTCLKKIRANEPEEIDLSQFRVPAVDVRPVPASLVPVHSNGNGNLIRPPGFVGELSQYIYESSSRPVQEIATAAAIALAAGVVGRQFNISGTGLNLYLILLAKTGVGKEEAIRGIDRVLSAVRPTVPVVDQFLGPGSFASGQGLLRTLDERPCFVSVLGEFGLMLQSLADSSAGTSHSLLYRKILLDLYSKSGKGSILRPSAYSDSTKNTKMLVSPAFTLFGESTPETFYGGLSISQIADGLIPRFLIMEYAGDRSRRNPNAYYPPPDNLTTRFAELSTVVLQMQANNSWADVGMESGAQKLIGIRQLWNRAHLKALKLAGILAAADRPLNPVVNEAEAVWAIETVRRDALGVTQRFETGDVGEGESKQVSDLTRIIREYFTNYTDEQLEKYKVDPEMRNGSIVPRAYLQRRTANMAAFKKARQGERNALRGALDDLTSSGLIEELPKRQVQDRFHYSGVAYLVRNINRL
jgi:hypothetical protein